MNLNRTHSKNLYRNVRNYEIDKADEYITEAFTVLKNVCENNGIVRFSIGKMASELSFNESIRTDSYASNGIHRCERCEQFVPYRSLAEHFELKHKVFEDNTNQRDESEKKQSNKKPTILKRFLEAQQARSIADMNDSSGSEFRQFGENNGNDKFSRSKGRQIDNVDSICIDTLTPKIAHSSRSSQRFNESMRMETFNRVSTPMIDSNDISSVRRRSAPTVYELFNVRSMSEMRTPKPNHDIKSMTGNTSSPFVTSRRSSSMSRAQPIPEYCERCPYCLNIMHKDYLESHIQRQHYVENDDIEKNSSVKNKTPHMKSMNHAKSKASKTPKGDKKKGKPKGDNFVRCNLCDSLMHNDYLPGHLVRRHRTEHGGSIGITWSQHTDDQLNKRLNGSGIFIKNRIFYFAEHETDD